MKTIITLLLLSAMNTLVLIARTSNETVINAKSHGAKGNGIQDDSPFLNDAIAKALLLGQDLFIPSGTYICNQLDGESKILRMEPKGAKNIRIFGEAGTKITTSQSTGCLLYIFWASENMKIENIFFESTHGITLTITNGIQMLGTNENAIHNLTIQNCRFEGFSSAIAAQGVRGLLIQNNIFESPKGHDNAQNNAHPAVFIGLSDNSNGWCYDVKILNNTVNGFTGDNIKATTTQRPMDGFVFGVAYKILIKGNITRNLCEEHIALQPQTTMKDTKDSAIITENKFYQALPVGCMKEGKPLVSNYGVRTDCNNVKIFNNDFYDYTSGVLILPFDYPILKQHSYEISGNRFYSPHKSMYYVSEAIKVQAPTLNPANNIIISGNNVIIDNIQMKASKSVISVYDCVLVTITGNTIKSQHVDLNGFVLSGILTVRCVQLKNENNSVVLKR